MSGWLYGGTTQKRNDPLKWPARNDAGTLRSGVVWPLPPPPKMFSLRCQWRANTEALKEGQGARCIGNRGWQPASGKQYLLESRTWWKAEGRPKLPSLLYSTRTLVKGIRGNGNRKNSDETFFYVSPRHRGGELGKRYTRPQAQPYLQQPLWKVMLAAWTAVQRHNTRNAMSSAYTQPTLR